MNQTLLRFQEVTFSYRPDHHAVLQNLSLDIRQGSISAILGPNGAGKTTLLHLALGWLRPQSGQVMLEDKPLGAYTRRELGKKMSLVPQNEKIAFEYSLLEYVLLGRAPYLNPLDMPGEEDCHLAVRALEQVGLGHLTYRSVMNLSGGELQLVLIARSLVQQPRLLLLDEPTSHLDLGNKGKTLHILKSLAESGVTILFTTHDPDAASSISNYLILMNHGKVLDYGALDEVFTSEKLTNTYHTPVKVMQVDGHWVALQA
jgi:iron complex transport system ATP-binding protein